MPTAVPCVRFELLPHALAMHVPTQGSALAAGYDLRAAVADPVVIPPSARALIPAGFRMELPPGIEAQVRPRSGLAIKHGVTVLNTPGTIDPDYRGEVAVVLINLGAEPFVVNYGERIAQLVFARFEQPAIELADGRLSETARGAGGFGSTGQS